MRIFSQLLVRMVQEMICVKGSRGERPTFTEKVNQKLEEGWRLHGYPQTVKPRYPSDPETLRQFMVRTKLTVQA